MSNSLPERLYATQFYAECNQQPEYGREEYVRADLVMQWIPIAEADLQDGDLLAVKFQHSYGLGQYSAVHHCLDDDHTMRDMRRAVAVLRIKPPRIEAHQ